MLEMIAIAVASATVLGYAFLTWRTSKSTRTYADFVPSSIRDGNATVRSSNEFSASTVATTVSLATVVIAFFELAPWVGWWLLWSVVTTALGIYVVRVFAPRIWTVLDGFGDIRPTLHGVIGHALKSSKAAKVAATCTTLGFVSAFAVELTVGGRFIAALIPSFSSGAVVILIALVTVVFTSLGGFRLVIVGDRLQMMSIWAMTVSILVAVSVLWEPSTSAAALPVPVREPAWDNSLWSLIIGLFLINVPTYLSDMSIWQRIAGAREREVTTRGLVRSIASSAAVWGLLVVGACLALGVAKWSGEGNPLPALLQVLAGGNLFTQVLAAVVVAGVFGALLSTASTQLIAASQALAADVFPSTRNSIHRVRATTLVVTVIAVAVVEGLTRAGFSVADLVFAIFGSQLCLFPIVYAILKSQGNPKISGTAASLAIALGFLSGWSTAAYGKVVDENGTMVFLSPVVSLTVSAAVLLIDYAWGGRKSV